MGYLSDNGTFSPRFQAQNDQGTGAAEAALVHIGSCPVKCANPETFSPRSMDGDDANDTLTRSDTDDEFTRLSVLNFSGGNRYGHSPPS